MIIDGKQESALLREEIKKEISIIKKKIKHLLLFRAPQYMWRRMDEISFNTF